jgi:glycosidase
MYEINLRAFSPSGDIRGIIDRLDHIADLHVNVIWLMPIHPIGQVNSVNSPYSVRNFKEVSPEYGTLEDLRDLTDAAHARGIAVIMDWVANHTAWDNPWINNRTWYTQDANGNIIHPAWTNWLDVADLNYENIIMRDSMISAMHYWLYEANIDGFRCDHADGVPFDFWQRAIQSFDTIPNRDFILLAEGTRTDHFTAGFAMNFGFQFFDAISAVYANQPVSRILTAHNNEYNGLAASKHWLRYTTNHDQSAWNATPMTLFHGVQGALSASAITIFTGGVPLLYGSQEVGRVATVPFFSNTTINWNDNPDMLAAYQKMLGFYAESDVARQGQNTVYPHNDVFALKKTYNNAEVLVIANVRNTTIASFSVPAELQNTTWTDVMTGNPVTLGQQLSLSPFEFYLLKE